MHGWQAGPPRATPFPPPPPSLALHCAQTSNSLLQHACGCFFWLAASCCLHPQPAAPCSHGHPFSQSLFALCRWLLYLGLLMFLTVAAYIGYKRAPAPIKMPIDATLRYFNFCIVPWARGTGGRKEGR